MARRLVAAQYLIGRGDVVATMKHFPGIGRSLESLDENVSQIALTAWRAKPRTSTPLLMASARTSRS